MDLPVYEVEATEDRTVFTFESVGRKGTIQKVVQFTILKKNAQPGWYNMALYDWVNGELLYKEATDNGDIRKVIATVYQIMLSFLEHYPDRTVVFRGSSFQRQLLYNRIVGNYAELLREGYLIRGRKNGQEELIRDHIFFLGGNFFDLFIINKHNTGLLPTETNE